MATALFAAIVAVLVAPSNPGQAPPPPPALDYFPQKWKEFTYESDNMRVRFPAAPKLTTKIQPLSFGTETSRVYSHRSFIELNLSVYEYAPAVDFEKTPDILQRIREEGLARNGKFSPQIIKEADIMIDGYAGKFIHLEASNGEVLRCKYFVTKNRMYFMYASVKKGSKHGTNYENDFEKVAMAFLDSLRLITPKLP
ncbi:MAG TPA: hypothetical protein VFZ40_08115 [Pyrinomonadaceae bacterium]